MSLNGLDAPEVKQAYEAATSEPGGWFLLKYASRDEVDLLGQGTGGIVEMRNAISQYEEASPLYGFLRYRRRNVLIKYLPENCSRLIQARVVVHFNAVSEKLTPYNTTFAISTAKELKDTKLSAVCSLHTASSSTSSSTSSLRRRRLIEIAEEEEEEQQAAKRQSVLREEDCPAAGDGQLSFSPSSPPVVLNAELAASPEASKFTSTTEPPPFLGVELPPSPTKSDDARRLSSQLSHAEMLSYASYPYGKPKVKLGPRPSVDTSGRPRTSAGAGNCRPVSSIPAGFKLLSKGSKRGRDVAPAESSKHAKEETAGDAPEAADGEGVIPSVIALSAAPSNTGDLMRPHTSNGRPTTSSGLSTRSAATTVTVSETKRNPKTPEMARLKKAMKLREMKKNVQPPLPSPINASAVHAGNRGSLQASEPADATSALDASEISDLSGPDDEQSLIDSFPLPEVNSADSAIDVGLFAVDHASVDTQTTDSRPVSPLAMPSEVGDSTKASSLSESTDETVQAPHDTEADIKAGCSERLELQDAEASTTHEPETVNHDSSPDSGVHAVAVQTPNVMDDSHAVEEVAALPSEDADAENRSRINPADHPKAAYENLEASVISTAIPTIAEPNLRDSTSTVDLESSVAASADAKRARRRAIVDPILTDFGEGLNQKSSRSEANLSDDEDFMEELQTATVQEAKPITVSKSPVTPVFPSQSPSKQLPRPGTGDSTSRNTRTASNPVRGSFLAPGDATSGSARSASFGAAFMDRIAQQSAANLAPKKANIGSSISQRIKALEKLSENARATTPDGSARLERPSSTFFSVRKTSGRESSRSPSVVDRASSMKRDKTPSPPSSQESSPEVPKLTIRDRSGSVASRLSVFEGGNIPRGRPESIQVRARILRDPAHPFAKSPDARGDSSDFSLLELKQSPLVVDLQKAAPALASKTAAADGFSPALLEKRGSIQERRRSREHRRSQSQDRSMASDNDDADGTSRRRRSSLSIVKDFIKERRGSMIGGRSSSTDNLNGPTSSTSLPTPSKSPSRPPSVHTTASLARRLSISSRRSSISRDRDPSTPLGVPLSPSLMTEAGGSGDESRPSTSELGQKGSGNKSRAGRFMKRLSSSFSSGRKAATPTISPTVAEEEEVLSMVPASGDGTAATQPSIVSFMGDVNVQFPDNLLWKRRTMCLDSQGFLILSTVNGVTATTTAGHDRPGGTIKRYHLSDFRLPYIPEMEVQELPNSVCLDFVDGSGLQFACEDRSSQTSVLQILLEAHQSHTLFGQ